MIDSVVSLASALLLAIVVSTPLAVSVFGPLTAVTNASTRSPRIWVSDLLVLAVHLQVAIAAVHFLLGRWSIAHEVAFASSGCILLTVWWYNGVRIARIWQAGGAWRRLWFLAVLAPLGHFAALTAAIVPACFVFIVLLMFAGFSLGVSEAFLAILPTLCLVVAQLLLLFLCRDACRRLASQITLPTDSSSLAGHHWQVAKAAASRQNTPSE